ncbi:MAG: hypothetical protein V2A34_07985, partial [Lentisphaerota bacterium]
RLKQGSVQRDLKSLDLSALLPILSLQMADRADKPNDVRWIGALQSDYFPILEYVAPRGFFVGAKATGAKWLDQRPQSPRNARLWIKDFLRQKTPEVADIKECYQFALRHPCLFEKSAVIWAGKWTEASPADAEAQVALAESMKLNHFEAMSLLSSLEVRTATNWGFAAGKLRSNLGMQDYLASRNWMSAGAASNLLEDVRWIIRSYPKAQDADLLRWQGQLLYDLGYYANAANSLAQSLQIPQRADLLIDAALLECEAWLKLGKPGKAQSIYEAYLKPFEDELRVWLMKARLKNPVAQG